ncbi:hypothetical protein IH992_06735 [Candidatus Poribacteria bacterium]|nr:hypothetical protein [Candidatus Poribacteria bacterium]
MHRGIIVRYVRILADVSFAISNGGWTEPDEAIIDTGGPISIIPRHVWEQIQHGFYSDREMEVLVGGRATMARFGQVTLRFHDAQENTRISPPLTIKASLLSDDSHPIVLGFEDFLTDVELHSNYPRQEVYLSFPPQ